MKNFSQFVLINTKEDLIKFYIEYIKKSKLKLTLKNCIFQDPNKTKSLLKLK